jgi:hypothetical protein
MGIVSAPFGVGKASLFQDIFEVKNLIWHLGLAPSGSLVVYLP